MTRLGEGDVEVIEGEAPSPQFTVIGEPIAVKSKKTPAYKAWVETIVNTHHFETDDAAMKGGMRVMIGCSTCTEQNEAEGRERK